MFVAGIWPSWSRQLARFSIDDIEETKGAMVTVAELTLVIDFLQEHSAPEGMSEAVMSAIADVNTWIAPAIQRELKRQAKAHPDAWGVPSAIRKTLDRQISCD